MEPSKEQQEAAETRELFPPTDSTFKEPRLRASLDDPRLADRDVGSSLSDQEIAGQAIRALVEDGRVDLGDGISDRVKVQSEGRVVTLSGMVDSAGERMIAEELVESIPGVEAIQNALTVGMNEHLDDEELNRRVRERLDTSGFAWVGSKLSHGVVRLMGGAEKLADAERAVQVAASVKGVRDVINSLKIPMPAYTDEIDLLSLANQALAIDDLVILDKNVRVSEGILEIAGRIQNLSDCRRIRRALSQVPGIRSIKTHLKIDRSLFRDFQARTHLSTGR